MKGIIEAVAFKMLDLNTRGFWAGDSSWLKWVVGTKGLTALKPNPQLSSPQHPTCNPDIDPLAERSSAKAPQMVKMKLMRNESMEFETFKGTWVLIRMRGGEIFKDRMRD